jgi:uncharacterized protein YigA (DUF484 family)
MSKMRRHMRKPNTLHLATVTMRIIRQRAADEGKSLSQVVDEAVAYSEVSRQLREISLQLSRIEKIVSTDTGDAKPASED